MNQVEFLKRIKRQVLAEDANALLILYGSRARGDFREDSDWDVLVLTSKKADGLLKRKISDEIFEIELEYLQPISTIVIEKDDWKSMSITPFYKNVLIEGKHL
jgi:predicted nucleotidyltransferase